MLICNVDNDTVDTEVLTWMQNNKKTFVAFQIHFFRYIIENQKKLLSFMRERTESICAMYQKHYSNARYAEYLALFCCTLELLEGFVEIEYGGIKIPFFMQARNCIMDCIQYNSSLLKVKGVDVQIAEILLWAMTSGEYEVGNNSKEIWIKGLSIYCDSEYAYIERSCIWEIVKTYEKKTGLCIAASNKSMLEHMMEEKQLVIKEFSEGRETIGLKRPIRGEADGRRFLKISLDKLNKLVEESEAM